MLGEQLIKNDRIALVELVKNSYDADATVVEVDFQGFEPDGSANGTSSIVITDNGVGMTEQVVRGAWMNPATPSKQIRKRTEGTTELGRVMQGEKGIGRFASFKLGSIVLVTSRAIGESEEVSLLVDLTSLDEGPDHSGAGVAYLDELAGSLDVEKPRVFTGDRVGSKASGHGTRIEISALRSNWGTRDFEEAFADMERMQPLMWAPGEDSPVPHQQRKLETSNEFEVRFLVDGVDQQLTGKRALDLSNLFERAVLRVTEGRFDQTDRVFHFNVNDRRVELPIDSGEVRGLRPFRDRFADSGESPSISCGSFNFEFYVFDFSSAAPGPHQLDREDKSVLKGHRIYLYRDGIRVYPYGDPEDDWLQIDRIRGTQSARSMFSNDQTVGYVTITQSANPNLQDKTNREGLIDAGRASGDLVALIQTVLAFLRAKPYEQYAAANRRLRERALRGTHLVDRDLAELMEERALPSTVRRGLTRIGEAIASERELSKLQLERTQDLAGVGLSVESASHDLIAAGTESLRLARRILRQLRELGLGGDAVYAEMGSLVQRLEFVDSRFQDVQGLFVSTRQKRASLDVFMYIRRVRSMYSALHRDQNITFEIDDSSAFRATSTEAAVLQCFINLVDNATYWLMHASAGSRIIRVFASSANTIQVSDSGPGISPSDEDYIFEPFYSGKGDNGKGLGLYIAREVGLRNGFSVDVSDEKSSRSLAGANFSIVFESTGE
nr:sensor histidine kinase [Plantibacter sp. CFBP 8798]